jgi:hypothetical protein
MLRVRPTSSASVHPAAGTAKRNVGQRRRRERKNDR